MIAGAIKAAAARHGVAVDDVTHWAPQPHILCDSCFTNKSWVRHPGKPWMAAAWCPVCSPSVTPEDARKFLEDISTGAE